MNKHPKNTEGFEKVKENKHWTLYKPTGDLPQEYRSTPEGTTPKLVEYTPPFNRIINPENAKRTGKAMKKVTIKGLEILGFVVVTVAVFSFGVLLAIIDAFRVSHKDMPKWESSSRSQGPGKTEVEVDVNVNVKVKK
jgi:hypothetical protein